MGLPLCRCLETPLEFTYLTSAFWTRHKYLPQISQKRKCKARQDVRRGILRGTATTLQIGAVTDFDPLNEARLRETTFAATVCLQVRLSCIRLRGLLSHHCMMPTTAAVPTLKSCSCHSLRQQCYAVK